VKPRINQITERIARPEKVCIIMEREFLLLISPASKKPRAGVISITRPVEISIHVVSPVSIGISLSYTKINVIKSFELPNQNTMYKSIKP
jgi:hypothetical protein